MLWQTQSGTHLIVVQSLAHAMTRGIRCRRSSPKLQCISCWLSSSYLAIIGFCFCSMFLWISCRCTGEWSCCSPFPRWSLTSLSLSYFKRQPGQLGIYDPLEINNRRNIKTSMRVRHCAATQRWFRRLTFLSRTLWFGCHSTSSASSCICLCTYSLDDRETLTTIRSSSL